MKRFQYQKLLGICMVFLGLSSCVDDLGNYDYIDKDVIMPVKIGNLRDTVVKPNELLKITPDLGEIADESVYEYYWYVRNTDVSDTLARTKDLAYEVHLSIGEYDLYYEVKDPERGIYARQKVLLTVSSQLGTGWYVMKTDNGMTDFDFIPDSKSGERWNNVILSSGYERLPGEPIGIYYTTRYTNEMTLPDGTVELQYNQNGFLVGTTEDLRMFNANTMELFKDYNGLFYEAPANCRPQNLYASMDFYLLNDGKIHTIAGNYMNSGKFGYYIPGLYELDGNILISPYGLLVFDKQTSSFLFTTSRASSLSNFPDSENGLLSPNNMENMELMQVLPWDANTGVGYALMKNDGEQKYYIIKIQLGRTLVYPFATITTVPYHSGYEVFDAEVRAASEAQCIYFAQDNLLKVYKNIASEERESVLKEFPAGERISYISPLKVFDIPSLSFFYYVEVLTNASGKYKLYRFEAKGSTPEINPEPLLVHEGEGTGKYIMYRAY